MEFKLFILLCSIFIKSSTSEQTLTINDKLLSILDNRPKHLADMNIEELVNVAIRNKIKYDESISAYEQKYGNFQIEISDKFSISNDVVHIDYTEVENFLKIFGHIIKRLSIAYNVVPAYDLKKIGRFVNIYCSDTLIEFQGRAVFDTMQKPFKSVERVSIKGELSSLEKDLNELFPEMQTLSLSYTGTYIFNQHHPHLMELNYFTSNNITELIGNNSQIRKLKLQSTTMETLQTVNEILPKLKTFAFDLPNNLVTYQGLPIQFNRVRDVTINDLGGRKRIGKIGFKQLKNLQLNLQSPQKILFAIDDWIAIIGENKGLNKLTIVGDKFRDSTFSRLSQQLNTLTEANFECYSDVKSQSITQFMERNPHIRRLALNFPNGAEKLLKNLTQSLDEDWKIIPENDKLTTLSLTKSKLFSDTDEEGEESSEEETIEIDTNTEHKDNNLNTGDVDPKINDNSCANTEIGSSANIINSNIVLNIADTNTDIDTKVEKNSIESLRENLKENSKENLEENSKRNLKENSKEKVHEDLNTVPKDDSNISVSNDEHNNENNNESEQETSQSLVQDENANATIDEDRENDSSVDTDKNSNEINDTNAIDENSKENDERNSDSDSDSDSESDGSTSETETAASTAHDSNANTSAATNTSTISQNATVPANGNGNGTSSIHSCTLLSIIFLLSIVSTLI